MRAVNAALTVAQTTPSDAAAAATAPGAAIKPMFTSCAGLQFPRSTQRHNLARTVRTPSKLFLHWNGKCVICCSSTDLLKLLELKIKLLKLWNWFLAYRPIIGHAEFQLLLSIFFRIPHCSYQDFGFPNNSSTWGHSCAIPRAHAISLYPLRSYPAVNGYNLCIVTDHRTIYAGRFLAE